MILQTAKWKIDSEWTLESSHFKYHYMISNNFPVYDDSQKKIKTEFLDYMKSMYGKPGRRWGFRFDRNFDIINLYFHSQEDAIIFRLTHE
jgi:hypothetical protein